MPVAIHGRTNFRLAAQAFAAHLLFPDALCAENGYAAFRGIEAKDIAGAMLAAAKRPAGKLTIYGWEEMTALRKATS